MKKILCVEILKKTVNFLIQAHILTVRFETKNIGLSIKRQLIELVLFIDHTNFG